MECELFKLYEESQYILIMGKVVRLEVADAVLTGNGALDAAKARPLMMTPKHADDDGHRQRDEFLYLGGNGPIRAVQRHVSGWQGPAGEEIPGRVTCFTVRAAASQV